MNRFSITVLRKRLFALLCVIISLFFLIIIRLFYVTVIWGEDLQSKAIDQWTRELPIVASRGLILDRNGVVLANNDDTYMIFARPTLIKEKEKVAETLSEILQKPYAETYEKLEKRVSEVTLKRQVKKDVLDKVLEENVNGIYYSRDNARIYPYGDFLSQIIGFTGIDGIGQSGIEAYYEKYLRGLDGEVLYETDIIGSEVKNSTPKYVPATDGLNVKLTIDYKIQLIVESVAEKAYYEKEPKSVSILVLDPGSGEILATTTKPSYNLNEVPRNDVELLNKVNRNAMIVDIYEPGSTFKVLTASADVEEFLLGNNAYSLNHVYSGSRYRYIDGQKIKCWSDHKNGKHSGERLVDALNNSCNPVFVDIAIKLGKERFYYYLDKFGYGKVTGIDFFGEASGMLIPENYCQNVDLARIGFGQALACTGLQLASATASAVNGGYYYIPHFLKEISTNNGVICEIVNPRVKNRTISEKASSVVAEMLESVVKNGSGKKAYIEGYRVGGKTGTAQKYENGHIAQGKYVSSFVGFFPANSPEYLALVVVDEPKGAYYGSTVAAPYAKEVFEGIINVREL